MGDGFDYATWAELFSEIGYAHETRYPPEKGITDAGIEYIGFYKLTIFSDGMTDYKGQRHTYNPKLWPRVKLLYSLFEEGGVIDTLY